MIRSRYTEAKINSHSHLPDTQDRLTTSLMFSFFLQLLAAIASVFCIHRYSGIRIKQATYVSKSIPTPWKLDSRLVMRFNKAKISIGGNDWLCFCQLSNRGTQHARQESKTREQMNICSIQIDEITQRFYCICINIFFLKIAQCNQRISKRRIWNVFYPLMENCIWATNRCTQGPQHFCIPILKPSVNCQHSETTRTILSQTKGTSTSYISIVWGKYPCLGYFIFCYNFLQPREKC